MNDLDELGKKLQEAQARQEAQNPSRPPMASKEMNQGMRAFMEMIGVILGSGLIGYALDRYFETAPILLIAFMVLGVIAGFFNLYKISQNLGTAIGSNSLQKEAKTAKKPSQNKS